MTETVVPPAADVVGRLLAAPELRALTAALRRDKAALVPGLWGSSVGAVIGGVWTELRRPIVVVCGHLDEADDLADDIELFSGRRPEVLPALELSGSLGRASEEMVANRLQLVSRLAGGTGGGGGSGGGSGAGGGSGGEKAAEAAEGWGDPESLVNPILVAPIQALMQSVPSRAQLRDLTRDLRPGMRLEAEKLIVWLSEHGYNRLEQVEVPGDFAVRGGIVDIYLPGEHAESADEVGLAVRVDFFDDEIESIKRFSLETLGSLSTLQRVTLLDIRGKLDDVGGVGESVSLLSYLPDDGVVAVWAPIEVQEQSKAYLDRLSEAGGIYPLSALIRQMARHHRLELTAFKGGAPLIAAGGPTVTLPVASLQRFEGLGDGKRAIAELQDLARTHDVTLFCENEGERSRLTELLNQQKPGLADKIEMPTGYLHRGFVFGGEGEEEEKGTKGQRDKGTKGNAQATEGAGRGEISPFVPLSLCPSVPVSRPIALLGHHELFQRFEVRRRVRKVIASRPVDSFLDLKVGDYVVHVSHGIAKFTGIQTLTRDGKSEEYLTLRFADDATLHVPATRVNLIQKYIGGFSGHPTLSRLGSGVWEKQKARVKEAVLDMAAELIEVQAARAKEEGLAFPPDTTWQKEFEQEFPYEPTIDQTNAAEEIKQDMQKRRPMDRLLCGDVGYGKTELAMRAAFKSVEYGKQVAVLVPTTVLAEQHERSFRERMKSYPFNVEGVSRFKTAKEIKETLGRVKAGEVDVLIGTHRLLSKDVTFADLGLVIVDEEQRFGVLHKERLKQMRRTVDVLTMSATPIPRTLSMSLLGLRDISSLTTAPQDRRSVVTEVMNFDPNRVKLAIQRELQREGQVYFVHNRVHSIHETADMIHKLVPDARIIVGHGQMGEGELEEVMTRFVRHEADVLVSTTIIESGLDIPNANTILIDNADRFGLSELHQLRGRVGRYKHRAYCYLLLPPDRSITEVASKRLKAIEEYSHLGAGFKIAMRDLELRGAGNILGPEQSGHIAAVGYEMYCQLLEEATRQIRNEAKEITPEAHVEIGVAEVIPKTYIPADRARLDVYRRLTRCTSIEMLGQLRQDTIDAYGELPRQVDVLLAMTELKLLAGHFGIDKILRQDADIVLTVRDAAKVQAGLQGAPGTIRVIDEKSIYLRMPAVFMQPETSLMVLKNLLRGHWDREHGTTSEPVPIAIEVAPETPDQRAPQPSMADRIRAMRADGLLPKGDGKKSLNARRLEAEANRTAPKEKPDRDDRSARPNTNDKPANNNTKPANPMPPATSRPDLGIRHDNTSAADRSRQAVANRTQGGAAQVKQAARSDTSAAVPKAFGGNQTNADYDKLLSLKEMGILSDAEFAAALRRLMEKQSKK